MSGGAEMLQLRLHFGERDRCGDGPLETAVMDACARHGVAAAALLRGVEGFGAKQHLRTERLLSLSEDQPLVTVAVAEGERVEALAAEVESLAGDGLLTVEPVRVWERDRGAATSTDEVRATVWGPRTGPRSPHLGAVAAFRRHGAEAATVLLGVDGVLERGRRRARFVAANRGVPALTVAIGARGAIDAALAEVDGAAPLVTVEAVETYRRIGPVPLHGEGVEPRWRISPPSLHGTPAVRTTLVTSEIATGRAHPRYLELIRALRGEGAAGATALRGVWGFRAGGEPHGDRVLALRRDVPMVVEAIDAPDRAARWHEISLEIAGDDDLVHCGEIPRALTLGS